MSCLLFDIAIEPLVNMLRLSSLKGFEIPGVENKLITTLFADDTTVFLSQFDKFTNLESILNKWYIASRACFNVSKAEIIPIGNPLYRKEVITAHVTLIPCKNHELMTFTLHRTKNQGEC